MFIKSKLVLNTLISNSNSNYFSSRIDKTAKSWSTFLQKGPKKKIVSLKKKRVFNLGVAKTTFGISNSSITKICNKFGLNGRINIKTSKCNLKTTRKVNKFINKLTFKRSLKSKIVKRRKFAIETLKNYKGVRYNLGYPIRGQRTHTNARTRKKLKNNKKQNYLT